MQNKILKNLFAPNRVVFFAGGGAEESGQKNAPNEAKEIREFRKKFESRPENLLDEANINNEWEKARDDLNKKVSFMIGSELENPVDKIEYIDYLNQQLPILDSLRDKYVVQAKQYKENFENAKKEAAKGVAEIAFTPEEVEAARGAVEVKLGKPEDFRKNAKQYVDANGKIDFKRDEAAEKAVRLVDIFKNAGAGEKVAVYKKGAVKPVIAMYDAGKKDFVDNKGKHVAIFDGYKVEKVNAVGVRVALGEKPKAVVKDLSAEIFPEEEGGKMAEKGGKESAEKKDKLTDEQRFFVNRARGINVELNKLMIKYQEKYGDRPEWKNFEQSVLKDIETRTDMVDNFEKNPDSSKIDIAQYIGDRTPAEEAESIIDICAAARTGIPEVQIALKEEGKEKTVVKKVAEAEVEGPKSGEQDTPQPEKPAAGFQTITTDELPEIKTPEVKVGKKEEVEIKANPEANTIAEKQPEQKDKGRVDLSKINDTYSAEIKPNLNPAGYRAYVENRMKALLLNDIAKAVDDEKTPQERKIGLELFAGFENKVYAEFSVDAKTVVMEIDEDTKKALVDRYKEWAGKA